MMVPLSIMEIEHAIEHTNDSPTEFQTLLARAAGAAGDADLDAFMRAAWEAFVTSRPGLREQLEEMRMLAQIEALREQGKVATA